MVVAFETAALTMVREAIDNGLYGRFVFGDAAKHASLARTISGSRLGNMYDTGPWTAPESASSAAWEEAYVDEHGRLPVLAYVKETHDATVVLALAAQAVGRLGGTAIRDRLRTVGGVPGTVVTAGLQRVADALRILARGGEVDYDGASGSMDWGRRRRSSPRLRRSLALYRGRTDRGCPGGAVRAVASRGSTLPQRDPLEARLRSRESVRKPVRFRSLSEDVNLRFRRRGNASACAGDFQVADA